MIPDRSQPMRTNCLTKYAYQEPPMIPRATNQAQARIVAENEDLPPSPTLHRGRPKLAVPKPRPVLGTRSQTMTEKHSARMAEEVKEYFKRGPLTMVELSKKAGFSGRNSASVKMGTWKKRGLVKIVGERLSTKGRPEKVWGLA